MYIVYFYLDDNIVLFMDFDPGYCWRMYYSNDFKDSDTWKSLNGDLVYFDSIDDAKATIDSFIDFPAVFSFIGDTLTFQEVQEKYGLNIGMYNEVLPFNYSKRKMNYIKRKTDELVNLRKIIENVNDKILLRRIALGKIFSLIIDFESYYKSIRNQIPLLSKKMELFCKKEIGRGYIEFTIYELIHNIWYYDMSLYYPYNYRNICAHSIELLDNKLIDKMIIEVQNLYEKLQKRSFVYSKDHSKNADNYLYLDKR